MSGVIVLPKKRVSYTIDTTLVKDMKIGDIFALAGRIERGGGAEKVGVDRDLGLAAQYVRNFLLTYQFNTNGMSLTIEKFNRLHNIIDEDYIQQHRLNYVSYYIVQDIMDWLDEKKRMNRTSLNYWKKAERCFKDYQTAHKSKLDKGAWNAVQDHMRITFDEVRPFIEPLENAIRDYLIQHRQGIIDAGQKDDIILLAKTYMALMFCAAVRNTQINFFNGVWDRYGVDFRRHYTYADIGGVGRNFVWMIGTLGVKFTKDNEGDYVPAGVDVTKSVRVNSEWNVIVNLLTNSEIMDENALAAINLNPDVKADYEARIAKVEQAEMDAALARLKETANVSSL